MPEDSALFARIETLFDVGRLADANVLIAGCGSGGGGVAQQLVMSGLRNFTLIDNDVLEIENVIRHVCGLRYVGMKKVEALANVLRDRNPEVQLELIDADIMKLEKLDELITASTVVIAATDNDPTRYRLNELCVVSGTPFVIGRVFTRGIGGEVFAFRPESGGCLACLDGLLERTELRDGVREIDLLSEEERDELYGLDVAEIKDSPGLTVDITFITAFHTRYALDAIASSLDHRPKSMPPIEENYIIWGNRPIHPFKKNFQLQRITLSSQDGCLVCGTPAE
ncbi:MAG: ThiF family adenylyltransferase [Pseudomonadales bacterium]